MTTLRSACSLVACSLLLLALPAQAQDVSFPDTYTVTKAADTDDGVCDADCSLREAIAAANADPDAGRIEFIEALAGATIAFAPGHGQLEITDSVVIDGDGLDITVDARQQDRVFLITGPSYPVQTDVELIGLTIAGGRTSGYGGGVRSISNTKPVLTRCSVMGNRADKNGGGVSGNFVTIRQSTVAYNRAGQSGGGVSFGFAPLVEKSTISNNRAEERGGGVYTFLLIASGTVTGSTITRNVAEYGGGFYTSADLDPWYQPMTYVSESIIAGNAFGEDETEANCSGWMAVYSGSLVSGGCDRFSPEFEVAPDEAFTLVIDPLLADNGGPTRTHALLRPDGDAALNPAVDVFDCEPGFDQRGFPAPVDGNGDGDARCDLGAVELRPPSVQPAVTVALDVPSGTIPAAGGRFPFTVTLTNTTDEAQTVEAWTAAARPSGVVRHPVLGPLAVTLAPGQTLSRTFEQEVPADAPAGSYAYLAYAGTFDDLAVLDRRAVAVTKATGLRAAGEEWEPSAAWPVRDAATGEPVAAGDPWGGADTPGASSSAAVAFALSGAYPNPFRSATELSLSVPDSVPDAQRVSLAVYDVLGREVAVLLDGEVAAGAHTVRFDGSGLPSGVYLVRFEAEDFTQTQRVTLVR